MLIENVTYIYIYKEKLQHKYENPQHSSSFLHSRLRDLKNLSVSKNICQCQSGVRTFQEFPSLDVFINLFNIVQEIIRVTVSRDPGL